MKISVVVPAHDEQLGIRGCLEALLDGPAEDELEVVVVCNGCSDRTADEARAVDAGVQVVETDVASKVHALNLGDESVDAFPRCYVDGDVQLEGAGLRGLMDALAAGALVAVPRVEYDLTSRPWSVRAFFRVWTRLPYFSSGMASVGVYAVSEEGRRRFERFPDLIADDHFVLSLFHGDERRFVPASVSVVQAPWSAADVVRVKTRAFLAQRQLQSQPDLDIRQHGPRSTWMRVVARDPRLWSSTPVYVVINLVAELRARRRFRTGDFRWERDRSGHTRRAPVDRQRSVTQAGRVPRPREELRDPALLVGPPAAPLLDDRADT